MKGFSLVCGAPPLQIAQEGTPLILVAMTSTIPFSRWAKRKKTNELTI